MAVKCFTSYEDQIRILKSRGLIIPDHQKAIEILSFENYYRLINGYKDLFLATTGPTETNKEDCNTISVIIMEVSHCG